MSKSLGNPIEPAEICDKWGADLLRLWVASQEYQADVKMSDRVMTQLSEAYRKIRNTFRFALGNLNDFDPSARRAAQRAVGRNRSLDAGPHCRIVAQMRANGMPDMISIVYTTPFTTIAWLTSARFISMC